MIEITPDSVIAGLKAIVEDAGEGFVYERVVTDQNGPKCVYVLNEAPSCIVGQFLAKLGVPLERLAVADEANYGAGLPAHILLNNLREEGVVRITDYSATAALSAAQESQDGGDTWGAALYAANRAIKHQF